MIVKVNDKEITLRYSFRSLILYENIQKKSFSPETTTDVLIFMFCVILSSEKDLEFNFNQFLDMIDENPSLVTEFALWLTKEMDKQNELSPEEESKKVKKNMKK